MEAKTERYKSCSKCLEKVLELQTSNPELRDWNVIGGDKLHCETCIKALKDSSELILHNQQD